jgi:dTDP-4-amino-4,6-dideoxygalactose transaminase
MVPWLDLTRQYQQLRGALTRTLDDLMARSSFILGPYVDTFEADFASFVGSKHCVGLNSGTSALHLALLACGVERGDEVVTTPATWISTCWAISYVGARPVFVDIDPRTCGLDVNLVEQAITPRTKAILPVHLYGQACDIAGLYDVAARHGIALIEDACQAHASTFVGKHLGTFGDAGCFSFYPGKNLGAFGEAGALVTDDDAIARRVRQLRDHAQASRHHHVEIGYNMRMEGVQGAVLGVKLPHLPAWTARRRAIGARYDAALADLPQFQLKREARGVCCNRHIYPLCCENRDRLREELARQDVQTAVHYPTPVHLQPAYEYLGHRAGDFPHAERLCRTQVTLPMFPELTDAEVKQTIDAVLAWAKGMGRAAA